MRERFAARIRKYAVDLTGVWQRGVTELRPSSATILCISLLRRKIRVMSNMTAQKTSSSYSKKKQICVHACVFLRATVTVAHCSTQQQARS
eukprot:3568840-Pleurochrysis_carterae.AAC.3